MSGSSFPSQTKPIRQLPISINLRFFGVGSLLRPVRRSQDDEGGRGRRTQPGVLNPGKIQSSPRPHKALVVSSSPTHPPSKSLRWPFLFSNLSLNGLYGERLLASGFFAIRGLQLLLISFC